MQTLNQRERFLKTIQHEEPDRVMYYVMGFTGHSYNEWLARYAEHLAGDQVVIDPVFGDRTPRVWLREDFIEFAVGAPVGYPKVPVEGREQVHVNPYGRIMNGGGTYAGRPYTWYEGPFFTSLEKREAFYAEYGAPWEERYLPQESSWKDFEQKLRHTEELDYKWMPVNRAGSIWEYIYEGLGPRLISYLSRKHPGKLHQVIAENNRGVKYCLTRMLEAGAQVVGISDDMGQKDRPLLSPKMFDTFLKPAYEELTAVAHKHGAKFWLHSCGNITELLPGLIAAGVDIWQSLEPASGVNLAEVKAEHGDRLTFVGAVDSSRILPFGTVPEVRTHVQQVLGDGMPGGGFIIGPAHDVMDIPFDNVVAMRDVVESKGTYP